MRLFEEERNTGMLEEFDASLIEQVKRDNAEFGRLLEEHAQYEQQLAAYNDLRFMTSAQEIARKRLQKLKLHGKDRMLAILHQYQVAPRSGMSTL
jgi:uncharacterized protein YdcH (DUF465 family)